MEVVPLPVIGCFFEAVTFLRFFEEELGREEI